MTTEQPDKSAATLDTEPEATKVATLDESTETESPDAQSDAVELTDEATPATAGRSRLPRILAAALAVLLVASAGLTAWLYFASYRPDQQTGPAASGVVLDAAKQGTVAALSYSPGSLDKDLDTAKSHLTGDFLAYYTEFTDSVVRPAVKKKSVSTTAEVVRAAVSELHPDQAKVLVFVNQTTTSADRPQPSMSASSINITMTKVDGKWLISAFDPV